MEQKKRHGFHLPKGRLGRTVFSLVITALAGFVYFYVSLPALNFQDGAFYTFLIFKDGVVL